MAVVINEFEVAVEQEASPRADEAPEASAPAAEHPTPEEVVLILRRHEARRDRIDAT